MRVRQIIVTTVSVWLVAMPVEALAQADGTAAQPEAQAGEAEGNGQPKPEPTTETAPAAQRRPVHLLPLVRVTTPAQDPGDSVVGGYVRFYVCDASQCGRNSEAFAGADRFYRNEHRDWLSRWLIGRTFSRFLTVKLSVARPNISATATLASSVLQSNRSVGESWNSELNGRRYLTPFLRVDSDTVVTVDVELNSSTQVQANITRAVMDVVGRAVQLVQPTSQLITSLNSDRFRQTSDFIDQSVSTLFATSLLERSSNQFSTEEWTNKELARIGASFPMDRRLLQSSNYMQIGNWRVMATTARISIFSDTPMYSSEAAASGSHCAGPTGLNLQACRAFIGLSPQTVLGLPVGENLTLGDSLRADETVSGELARLAAATTAEARTPIARRVCTLISSKAESLGLNRYDAAAAVWAYVQEAQMDRPRQDAILASTNGCNAAQLLERAKRTLTLSSD